MSLVNTDAASPYVESLACSTTSVVVIRHIIKGNMVSNLTVLGFELHDTSDRAKYLFSDDLHAGLALCENCWLNEVSLVANLVAAKVHCSTFSFSGVNIPHDALCSRHRTSYKKI
jgi:hypothetical protein